jgi:hypothetical protein
MVKRYFLSVPHHPGSGPRKADWTRAVTKQWFFSVR